MSTDDPRNPAAPPYRPPAPGEVTPEERVCPDCIHDPDHQSPGGRRPVEEFRLITGKAAERYKDGKRYAAYCRYHENKRLREARAARRQAGEQLTPEQLEQRRKRNRKSDAARRKDGRRRETERKRAMVITPEHKEVLKERRRLRYQRWASQPSVAAARKAYRARWWQQKVDKEIAEGKRPPRDEPRRRGGRPRKWKATE